MKSPALRSLMLTLAFLLVAAGCQSMTSPTDPDAGLLRHVVLFQFTDSTSADQVRRIEDAFRALPEQIPSIRAFEWGLDVGVEQLNNGFTHCFVVSFADATGRDAYLPHPAHRAFVALAKPSFEKVLVIDYVAGR